MTIPTINPERFLDDLNTLRGFGRDGTGVHRLAYSPEDLKARAWVLERLTEAGLEAWIDGIGNIHGRWPGVRRAVLSGSHIDTVPHGGWLDGSYGVIAALEVVRSMREAVPDAEVGFDFICFADEEGTYRGTLGSSVFSGLLPPEEFPSVQTAEGVALTEALGVAGYSESPVELLDPERDFTFVELHIEQGPTLEQSSTEIGVVTDIVGMRRFTVTFSGRADHAGTTPMDARLDAARAAITCAGELFERFQELSGAHTVWNLGHIALEPGASNVVPSKAEFVIEYRDVSDDRLNEMDAGLAKIAADVASRSGCRNELTRTVFAPPVEMAATVIETITAATERLQASSVAMPSGAGHDSMNVARLIPTGMIFVPSIDGRSHDVAENTSDDDLVRGVQVLAAAMAALAAAGQDGAATGR